MPSGSTTVTSIGPLASSVVGRELIVDMAKLRTDRWVLLALRDRLYHLASRRAARPFLSGSGEWRVASDKAASFPNVCARGHRSNSGRGKAEGATQFLAPGKRGRPLSETIEPRNTRNTRKRTTT